MGEGAGRRAGPLFLAQSAPAPAGPTIRRMMDQPEEPMAAPEKLVTAELIDQKPAEAEAAEKPAVGAVTRKGAPPPEIAPRRADEMCTVRITKTGHGQVHDGNDGRYDWNDEVVLPVSVGRALEGRSFGEIVG